MRYLISKHARRRLASVGLFVIFCSLAGCGPDSQTRIDTGTLASTAFDWKLPATVPLPVEPLNNPMTEEKFQLGRHLFYDKRLSGNGSQSCSSCHQQSKAFTDGLVTSTGSTGETHPRNAQPLANVAYFPTLTWANPTLTSLEQQIVIPLFGDSPIEHGITDANKAAVMQRLRDESVYAPLFAAAFPGDSAPFTYENVIKALASFTRGITSFNSAVDQYEAGNNNALSAKAKRGMALFNGERLECFHCHAGYNFSDSSVDRFSAQVQMPFHNTGLYNIGGTGAFPEGNRGVFELTEKASDMGKFRAASLRNVAVTAPYMHDGSIASLEDVIRFYSAGGRQINSGPLAGDGRRNPFKSDLTVGFSITDEELGDVIAFLQSLTDEELLTNPRFSNPWISPP